VAPVSFISVIPPTTSVAGYVGFIYNPGKPIFLFCSDQINFTASTLGVFGFVVVLIRL
jgi:hypothetical protein